MKAYVEDTIAAIATANGTAGIAIIRVSGKNSLTIARKLLTAHQTSLIQERKALTCNFYSLSGELIDKGLLLYFKGPNSFTGEDIIELHGHGGVVVVNTLLEALTTLGARLAEPGEFSKRAYLNNKIDLLQAEAIADLITSRSKKAAKSALRSLQGDFSKQIKKLQENITKTRVLIEAAIDFSDDNIEEDNSFIYKQLNEEIKDAKKIITRAKKGLILNNGITISIIGKPNVGKSSLLNNLLGNDLAIVSELAGTTRDIIRANMNLDGIPVTVADTAGLRFNESIDQIEKEGIKRALEEIKKSDIILYIKDITCNKKKDISIFKKIINSGIEEEKILTIENKIDLLGENNSYRNNNNSIYLSLKTKEGLSILKNEIKKLIKLENEEDYLIARNRHVQALSRHKKHLKQAARMIKRGSSSMIEIAAEELRLSQKQLSLITGEVTSDDILAEIFSSFCIGK